MHDMNLRSQIHGHDAIVQKRKMYFNIDDFTFRQSEDG